jgi:hypothetical protein
MTEKGELLAMGGAGHFNYGGNAIEGRFSTGGEGWEWRKFTDNEIRLMIKLFNAAHRVGADNQPIYLYDVSAKEIAEAGAEKKAAL